MNTTELVAELAKKMSISKTSSRHIINFISEKIVSEVKKGKAVKITGFGIFHKTSRKGRMGRNPQNGTPVEIAPKKVPRFKAGKKFRDALN